MELSAFLFGFIILMVSVVVTYHWGIKPDREMKKRRAELAQADTRRRRQGLRRRPIRQGEAIHETQ